MPFTLHGTPNFILTPTVEVEAQSLERLSRIRRAMTAIGRGPVPQSTPDFLPFSVNKRLKFAGSAGISQ
jgi:hypothetical protein